MAIIILARGSPLQLAPDALERFSPRDKNTNTKKKRGAGRVTRDALCACKSAINTTIEVRARGRENLQFHGRQVIFAGARPRSAKLKTT